MIRLTVHSLARRFMGQRARLGLAVLKVQMENEGSARRD